MVRRIKTLSYSLICEFSWRNIQLAMESGYQPPLEIKRNHLKVTKILKRHFLAKSRPRRGVILYDVLKESDIDYLHGQSTQLSYIIWPVRSVVRTD